MPVGNEHGDRVLASALFSFFGIDIDYTFPFIFNMNSTAGPAAIVCALVLVLLGTAPIRSDGANILVFPGLGEATHSLVPRMLGERLVDRGHNVTIVTSSIFVNSSWHASPSERIPFVVYQSIYEREYILGTIEDFITKSVNGDMTAVEHFKQLDESTKFFSAELESVLGDYEIMQQLIDGKHDLALIDPFALFPLFVVERLRIPAMIPHNPGSLSPPLARLFGLPSNPSYVPDGMTGLSHRMSFMERLQNTLSSAGYIVFKYLFLNGFNEKRHLWNVHPEMSTAEALMKKSHAWLVNSNFVLDYPRPFLPHTGLLGGSLIRPASPISPGVLLDFLDGAGDSGAVLVSLGSFVTSMDEKKLQILTEAFAKLPNRVLWRLPTELTPSSIGSNTLVVPWIPQNDVLGHSNVIAFVSNGGGLGGYEATYQGVPVVSIPFFTDHPDNAARLVSMGVGVVVKIQTMTTEILYSAITQVTSEPSYKREAQRWSEILRDFPDKGLDYACFIVEHVIKHGGDITRAKGQSMTGYQYYLVDVCLFLIIAFHVFEFAFLTVFFNVKKIIMEKCC